MEYEKLEMAGAKSLKQRAVINHYAEGIEVIIPARKSQLVNFILVLWMLGWAYGEVAILGKLTNIDDNYPDAILVFWICGWTLCGLFAVLMWLWNTKGR